MDTTKRKAVVALSGGLDSSVVAWLLKEEGYEVIGLTGKMIKSEGTDTVIQNAKSVAECLGIEHHVYDATALFKEKVIDYFEKDYECGKTPNPCIMCNKFVKWGVLYDFAINKLGADVFATGHYANIVNDDGNYKLFPAKDEHKDQLYFLYRLNQEQLAHTVFPLSKYSKAEVRAIAERENLPTKSSKESQDICFIQKPMTSKKYLTEKFGIKRGDFLDILTDKKWGEHDGCYQYTIGQRKGIGIAAPYPLYVIKIDAQKNIVYVGREEDNYKTNVKINDLNLLEPLEHAVGEFDANVKIRYNMPAKKAHVKLFENFADITFYEPINSVTSGQAGVLYDVNDGHLIGGGTVI